MTEREELCDRIAMLEGERIRLRSDEKILNDLFWSYPSGTNARIIDSCLDEVADRLDAISDELGPLRDRLYEIDADQSRREMLADQAYGRTIT